MSISKTRGFLYWLAKLLGDVQAVKSSDPNDDQKGRPPGCRQGHRPGDAQAVQIAWDKGTGGTTEKAPYNGSNPHFYHIVI